MVGNLSRRISPELYQSVIALSRQCAAASLRFYRATQSPVEAQPAPLRSPLLPYHFAPPESPEVAAQERPGPYGWLLSWRTQKDTEGQPIGWLLLSCHFRLSGRRHRYISLFIFRLLNYIPINNALPTPDELIYHSTGSTAGGLFSSRKPSNRRICHLDLNSSTEGIGLPFHILGRRLISVINVVLALGEILSQQYGNTLDENSNPRLLFV